jgi:DNA-binding CsgD family transcriptional regulator
MAAPYPSYDGTQPCRDNPEVFFPAEQNTYPAYVAAAKLCADCPFLDACRAFAIDNNVRGYWAGTALSDRRRERVERGIVPLPVSLTDREIDYLRIAEVDDGTRGAAFIAEIVGCSQKTVERHLRAKYGYRGRLREEVA